MNSRCLVFLVCFFLRAPRQTEPQKVLLEALFLFFLRDISKAKASFSTVESFDIDAVVLWPHLWQFLFDSSSPFGANVLFDNVWQSEWWLKRFVRNVGRTEAIQHWRWSKHVQTSISVTRWWFEWFVFFYPDSSGNDPTQFFECVVQSPPRYILMIMYINDPFSQGKKLQNWWSSFCEHDRQITTKPLKVEEEPMEEEILTLKLTYPRWLISWPFHPYSWRSLNHLEGVT